MNYAEYLKTDHWQRRRKRAIDRAGGHCVVCRKQPVQVHHNSYQNIWNEHDDDLAVLCDDCHEAYHFPDTPDEVPDEAAANTDFWPVVLMSDGHYRKGQDAAIWFRV